MSKTLKEYQQGMPAGVAARHDAMSAKACQKASHDLQAEAMKCDYFGNTCPVRGKDALAQASDNFSERADYFELLAKSKEI